VRLIHEGFEAVQTVRLGRTGLTVSVAALGAGGKNRLGQSRGATRESSIALVQSALDAGVTLLDTAAVYGTEELVGAAIKGRRDEVIVSTKVLIAEDLSSPVLIDAAEFVRRVDGCLSRLDIETIDILHLHGVTAEQYEHSCSEMLPALVRLREAGKIRFTGITEYFNKDQRHAMLSRAVSDALFDVIMLGFNFIHQLAERRILPEAKRQDIGVLCMYAVRGPLAKLDTANALVRKVIEAGEVDATTVDAANPLGFLLEPGAAGSLSEAAYRFCRHTLGVDVVITGTSNVDHLKDNLRAIQMPSLPLAVRERLTKIFGNVVSETADS
jgi:L-galactose dehydrogenase